MNKKEIDKITAKIMKQVGKKVNFTYPTGEGKRAGRLLDRHVMKPIISNSGVPYFNVVDLIKFDKVKEPLMIRIGYYRWKNEKLVWGSQTTITETPKEWKKLIHQTAAEKKWFRYILE